MASMAGDGTSYGGAGGKFRKRPFRRPQTTPYDRPPTSIRNPRTNNGWLSKLVDPATKLISASAHLFFSSSLFRKRLPPPPLPPPPPEANEESRDSSREEVLDNPSGVQGPSANGGGKQPTNSFDNSGLSELEQILKQKTFTRSEIDRLTELLHSRTVDLPNGDEDRRTETILPQSISAFGRRDAFASSPMEENKSQAHLENHKIYGCVSPPVVSSQVLEEDVATPADLAKAYMGNRPSKVSPSMLGLRGQALREDASLLNSVPVPSKSPFLSVVPKPAVRVGIPENGIMTPKSRGRSAIYNMARTPYTRVHPSATQKGMSSKYDGYGGLSASSSSSKFAWEHDRQYGSTQLSLKRRSSVLEDDIGSVGPIRKLRQKTNLSTPKNLSLTASRSSLSSRGTGVGFDSTQYAISSAQKLPSLDESKDRISKTVGENEDNSMPGTSYTPVPSKSTEMATKILQQLEKLVPKEKSSEGKVVSVREKSPSKLTLNMLRGQALRSLEVVDSSKVLHDAEDNHKLKEMHNTSLPDAQDMCSQKQDKVEENGPNKFMVSRDTFGLSGISNAAVSANKAVPGVKTVDSVSTQFGTQPPLKKWAFQISAHEDFLELEDENNEAASTVLAEGKQKLETAVLERKAVSSEAVTVEKASTVSEFKTPSGLILKNSTDLRTFDGTTVGEKNSAFTFPDVPASSTTFQPVVASSQSVLAFDKIVPPKESNAPPPLFSFGSKNIDKIPSLTFSSSSSGSESSGVKSSAPLESKPDSSNSLANISSGATDIIPKIPNSDKVDDKNVQESGDMAGKPETSISSTVSTSASTSIFSFGAPANGPSLSNGSLYSSPSIFSSPSPVQASNNFTSQTFTNSFTNVTSSTTATIVTNGTTTGTPTSNSLPASVAAASFPATPIFKFGSSSAAPSNSHSTVSTTSNAETTILKDKTEKETTFGNLANSPFGGTSSAVASTGSSIFGFSASATSSANNLSQSSLFGTSGGSLVSTQASPAGTGVATVTQSMPIQFGSTASSSIFGASGITALTSSSSLFGSSSSSSSLFGSSSSSSLFGSSTSSSSLFGSTTPTSSSPSFGQSSVASSSEANSSGTTSSLFGSSWQPATSSVFNTTFSTASPSTGFSFGAPSVAAAATNSAPMVFGSSSGASSGSMFSFTPAAATSSSSPAQSVFGSSVPVFTAASGNGDQMNMEDSMSEDPIQASSGPTVPVFGQPPISAPSTGFVFGSTPPSAAPTFQFGGQPTQSTQQNPSLFQTSGSLEFTAGGSFSLGSAGDDKSTRKIVRVKRPNRRR